MKNLLNNLACNRLLKLKHGPEILRNSSGENPASIRVTVIALMTRARDIKPRVSI
jgi:hypothetical protein